MWRYSRTRRPLVAFITSGGAQKRCARTIKTLYEAPAGVWGCKRCLRLAFDAEGQSAAERAVRRLRKIRRYCMGSEDLDLPFPACPEGMKLPIYKALREEARQLEDVIARAIVKGEKITGHGVRRSIAQWWPARHAASRRKSNRGKIGGNGGHTG
jgi:hypothetical protein